MLKDGGKADAERLGKLRHGSLAARQPREHSAADRIGQRLECAIELLRIVKHVLKYRAGVCASSYLRKCLTLLPARASLSARHDGPANSIDPRRRLRKPGHPAHCAARARGGRLLRNRSVQYR